MKISIICLSVLIIGLMGTPPASGLPSESEPGGANLKAGQMFTVKIVPRSKRIDVFVVGNEVVKAFFDDVGLEASIKVGTRTWTLKPDRQKDHFSVTRPDFSNLNETSQLLLKVRTSDKTEDFKFPLDRH